MITATQRIVYQFLTHAVILLVIAVGCALTGAVKFLGVDALTQSLPYSVIAPLTDAVLLLALTSGVIGGGLYAFAHERADRQFPDMRLLRDARIVWTLLCALTVIAGFFGLLNGNVGTPLPPLLSALFVITLALVIAAAVRGIPHWGALPMVWMIGVILLAADVLLGMIPFSAALDRVYAVIAAGMRDYGGIGLGMIALLFWQMHRFSDLSPGWVNLGAYSVGGFWLIAALLLTVQPLYTLADSVTAQVGTLGVFLLPVAAVILASHTYLALTHRNNMRTLSAHWVSLALVLLFIGVGVLGAVSALPDVHIVIAGTRLTDLQRTLILFAFAAVLLGTVNQVGAELRHENRHITGLAPFWLVSLGLIVISVGLGGAGIVQVYLERLLSVGYLETQTLIVPLYTVWVIGWIGVLLGIVVYALGFWARRVNTAAANSKQ